MRRGENSLSLAVLDSSLREGAKMPPAMREVSRRVPRKRRDEGSFLRRRGELPQSRGARQLPQGGSLRLSPQGEGF